MASTRNALASIEEHLLESMGSRGDGGQPRLAPIPHAKHVGRRPLDGFGCLNIDQVVPDPAQPRTDFPEESWAHLADSIRDKGQLAPIRVRWSDELGKWVIIAGEPRWRATKLAGLPTIECFFHADKLSQAETLEQQLIENLLREDLKPLEEALAEVQHRIRNNVQLFCESLALIIASNLTETLREGQRLVRASWLP